MPAPYPGRVHAAYPATSTTLCGVSTAGLTVVRPGAVGVTCPACKVGMRRKAGR